MGRRTKARECALQMLYQWEITREPMDTVADEAQALARSAPGPGNKGAEAARAAVAMVHVLRKFTTKTQRTQRRKDKRGKA